MSAYYYRRKKLGRTISEHYPAIKRAILDAHAVGGLDREDRETAQRVISALEALEERFPLKR